MVDQLSSNYNYHAVTLDHQDQMSPTSSALYATVHHSVPTHRHTPQPCPVTI